VQSTLGVGGYGNICFGHVLVAVRQGQRRDAVATGEEQFGKIAARKGKYIRLYLCNVKLVLAATYLRRARDVGRSFAAGASVLTHVCTVGACGTKLRRGPPEALPGAGVWRHPWGDGAHCRSAAQRGHGAHCPRFLVPQPYSKQQNLGCVDSRFDTIRSSSAFHIFGIDSKMF
jgi:hypothetical protein